MSDNANNDITTQLVALCKYVGVTPRLFEALLHHFGNLERIIRADSGALMAIEQMSANIANKITRTKSHFKASVEFLAEMKKREITVTTRFDSDYPQLLFELNDPPPIIYCRGRLPHSDKKTVALVGADKATNEGMELTTKLAATFAKAGVQVVSSLDKGISAAAHLGTRVEKGVSYAVLDSGFDELKSEEQTRLAIDITNEGGLVSEYPPATAPSPDNYKALNRIIIGLSQAVVVTEVYKDSEHTLDLLKCCNQVGKLSFVIIDPRHGALTDEASLNQAVSQGALPMVGLDKIDDIIATLV
jgi:DNA processing protein